MTRNPWTRLSRAALAIALTAAGAICAAAPAGAPQSQATLEPHPATPANVCEDHRIGETFGGDAAGCREYLDACLDELTTQQRAEWSRSVNACISDGSSSFYRCYAEVPWC